MGNATLENRHGLAVAGRVTHAMQLPNDGASEIMPEGETQSRHGRRITAGEDKRTIPPICRHLRAIRRDAAS